MERSLGITVKRSAIYLARTRECLGIFSHMAKEMCQRDHSTLEEEWRLPVVWCSVFRVKYECFRIETSPLGPTAHEKGNDQQQQAFSLCLFSDILRSFYEY